MKNNRNKIIAAVICGLVVGSVGTSIIGHFEVKNASVASSESADGKIQFKNSEDFKREKPENREDMTVLEDQGKAPGHHKGESSLENTESINVSIGNYKDGEYKGTADGYAKNLTVEVKINDGKIENVDIVSNNETSGFCEKAFETVPAEIIKKQSTDVDTVSGATYSSIGIINAVNNALESAKA